MANWMSGRYGSPDYSTGWIGRWLDGLPPIEAQLAVAEVGISLPLHLRCAASDRRPNAIPTSPVLIRPAIGSRLRNALLQMHSGPGASRGYLGDAVAAATASTIQLADDVAVAYPATPLQGGFVGAMAMAARLINANVGLRVISVALDGFDTHHGQPGVHPGLLAQLDAGLAGFYATLDPAWASRVAVATLSEFGRTPHSNASAGTDHGTSNTLFLIGSNVKGGHHGEPPRLATLDRNRLTIANLDFRAIYANLITDWLGADGAAVVGSWSRVARSVRRRPGRARPPPATPAAPTPSRFVPISPIRVFDTRDGSGGRHGQGHRRRGLDRAVRRATRRAGRGARRRAQPHRRRPHPADLRDGVERRRRMAGVLQPQPAAGTRRAEPDGRDASVTAARWRSPSVTGASI